MPKISPKQIAPFNGVAEKAAPVGADRIPVDDSADSYSRKYVLLGSIAGSATAGETWQFDTATADADPGSKKFRLNNATQPSATWMYVSDIAESGADMSTLLLALAANDRIYIQENEDASRFHLVRVTGSPTDAVGYVKIPIAVEDSGSDLENGKKISFWMHYTGGGAGGTDEKVKVSSDDTTADYLQAKLIGTTNRITATEVTPGGDEDLQLNCGSDILDKTTTGQIDSLTAKTTPVGADKLLIEDSAASHGKKELQISNLKAGALPVGAPSDVGTANAEGSSTDLVRKDHVHKRAYPRYHMAGLAPVYVSASSMGIDPGSCRSDDDTTNIDVTSQVTAAFGTSGAGGLDTGSESANTHYYLWLISKADGADPAAMISASSSSPTMPSLYTKKQRVGTFRNDGSSNIIPYRCIAQGRTREYNYTDRNQRTTLQLFYDGSAQQSSWELVSAAAFLPPTSTYLYLYLYVIYDGDDDGVEFTNNNSNTFGFCWRMEVPDIGYQTHFIWIETTSGQGIYYRADDDEPIWMYAMGFKEEL